MSINPGDRVVSIVPITRGMDFSIPAGLKGTVTEVTTSLIGVKLDDFYPELSQWDNIVYFYADMGDIKEWFNREFKPE
jgi:hypothetical protein